MPLWFLIVMLCFLNSFLFLFLSHTHCLHARAFVFKIIRFTICNIWQDWALQCLPKLCKSFHPAVRQTMEKWRIAWKEKKRQIFRNLNWFLNFLLKDCLETEQTEICWEHYESIMSNFAQNVHITGYVTRL